MYLVHQLYDSQTAYRCSPGHGKQSAAKGIFVHLLYGFVRLPKSDPNSALRLCVYNLYQTGRERRTLYERCTTPKPLTDIHQAVENNVQ